MTELTPAQKWTNEQAQADKAHHTPTAGAMTGHIVANLEVLSHKLLQSSWYVTGLNHNELREQFAHQREQAQTQLVTLGQMLIDEGEMAPSTTQEFVDYSMLEEAGAFKYESATAMIDQFAHDYYTENLFVTRAIKLAQKEERPVLAAFLTELLGSNNHNIAELQAMLGRYGLEGLAEEDEDD